MTVNPVYQDPSSSIWFKFSNDAQLKLNDKVIIPTTKITIFGINYNFYENLKYGQYVVLLKEQQQNIVLDHILQGFDLSQSPFKKFNFAVGNDVVILEGNSSQNGPVKSNQHDIYLQYNQILPPLKLESGYQKMYPDSKQISIVSAANNLISTFCVNHESHQQDFLFYNGDEQIQFQAFWWNFGNIIGNQETTFIKSVTINPSNKEYKSIATSKTDQTYIKIGHRGCGMNKKFVNGRVKIAENTVQSFNKAYDFGMDMIETDVIITKDGIPVINHDFKAKFNGMNIAINSITYEQFKTIKIDKSDDDLFKGCLESSIHMPSLQELLLQVNPFCGINLEVKYPSTFCKNIGLQYFSRVEVIKIILDLLKEFPKRKVYFSSFDPQVCSILTQVQNKYPVFFLHCGIDVYEPDEEVNMAFEEVLNANQGLIRAKQIGVQGMVLSKGIQLWDKNFVKKVKNEDLKVFTYGTEYDDVAFVQQQYDNGVDGIIFDLVNHNGKQSVK